MTVRVLPWGRGREALPLLSLDASERAALREIANGADLIFVDGATYLVAPVSPACLDALAAFEADAEDREPNGDLEPSIGTFGDLEGDDAWHA